MALRNTGLSPRRKLPIWWVVLGVLVVAGAAYALWQQPWTARPRAVAVEIVVTGPAVQALAVNGRIAARQSVDVRAAVSAQAREVLATEGQTVAAGDLLVRLDDAGARAQVDQAQAALDAGLVKQEQARAAADRAVALGDNASRSTRDDAELAYKAASNEVERLRAALAQARTQLDQYVIRSPLSGVVLGRDVEQGQLVDPQTVLFTVADLSNPLVETDVDELYSSRMRVGLEALLLPAGESVSRPGHVAFASPKVDADTGGRAIRIDFDTPVDLPVGLTVNANIVVSRIDAALTLPRRAIVTEGITSHVLIIIDGKATERQVTFADWPADRVVVTEGVAAGDVVILDPTVVKPGQSVRAE